MMKRRVRLFALAVMPLLIALSFTQCANQAKDGQMKIKEYKLPESYNYPDIPPGALFVVRSAEELEVYKEGIDLPAVNFEKYTLFLSYGYANHKVKSVEKTLVKEGEKYSFVVDIITDTEQDEAPDVWKVGVLVPVMEQGKSLEYRILVNGEMQGFRP